MNKCRSECASRKTKARIWIMNETKQVQQIFQRINETYFLKLADHISVL